jgi:hypothetical protein
MKKLQQDKCIQLGEDYMVTWRWQDNVANLLPCQNNHTMCWKKCKQWARKEAGKNIGNMGACCNHSMQVQQMEDGMHEMEWVRFYLVDHGIKNCPAIQCNGIHAIFNHQILRCWSNLTKKALEPSTYMVFQKQVW